MYIYIYRYQLKLYMISILHGFTKALVRTARPWAFSRTWATRAARPAPRISWPRRILAVWNVRFFAVIKISKMVRVQTCCLFQISDFAVLVAFSVCDFVFNKKLFLANVFAAPGTLWQPTDGGRYSGGWGCHRLVARAWHEATRGGWMSVFPHRTYHDPLKKKKTKPISFWGTTSPRCFVILQCWSFESTFGSTSSGTQALGPQKSNVFYRRSDWFMKIFIEIVQVSLSPCVSPPFDECMCQSIVAIR